MYQTNQDFCVGQEIINSVQLYTVVADSSATDAAMAPFLRGESERQRSLCAAIQQMESNSSDGLLGAE